jgi:CIC family chloride channel protein
MLNDTVSMQFLFILLIVRFVMTMVSYTTGSPGGIFAPMLALGTLFGLLFGHVVNDLFSFMSISPATFAVVGMGALFSASIRAPLTGLVLVVELTQNYTLVLPLLITSFVAIAVVHMLGGRPLYTLLLDKALSTTKKL